MFTDFSQAVHKRWSFMLANCSELYVTRDGDDMWDRYLSSFPEGTNPIYRERTEHDCSCCRNFIKNIGGVIGFDGDGERMTVWDYFTHLPAPYDTVAEALSEFVKDGEIRQIFRTTEGGFGAESTREMREGGEVKTWHHFHGSVPSPFKTASPGTKIGEYASSVQVLQRGLEEITPDALSAIIDLSESKTLYRGEEFLPAVRAFWQMKVTYETSGFDPLEKREYVWRFARNQHARFRNTAIGTLAVDLSEGVDIETAVRSFESKVAPTNYKRPTALITKGMIDQAMKTMDELGIEPALRRRMATIADVSINDVLWADPGVRNRMKAADSVRSLLESAVAAPFKGEGINIGIDDFLQQFVPQAQSMEIFVENKHQGNFVTLTAPADELAPPLFKWPNPFAWSYDGNITDAIKERVKAAGGKVDGKFRVSLSWFNHDDLDIHCLMPTGDEIYYGRRHGILDVDMNAGWGVSRTPVENLSWQRFPADGVYKVGVHNFCRRESDNVGFEIQIEGCGFNKLLRHEKPVPNNAKVNACNFTVKDGEVVEIDVGEGLSDTNAVVEKWGISTGDFRPVNTMLLSPNHWGDSKVGNKHWIFTLDGCKADAEPRGIYNEYLRSDLEPHRKVFEVLGSKTKCPLIDDQLSGLGFSSTRGDTAKIRITNDKGSAAVFNVAF